MNFWPKSQRLDEQFADPRGIDYGSASNLPTVNSYGTWTVLQNFGKRWYAVYNRVSQGARTAYGSVYYKAESGYEAFYCDGQNSSEKSFTQLDHAQGFVEGNYDFYHPTTFKPPEKK